MYIPVTKSCAVRGAGGPEYKRNNATANMLLDMGDDKLQSAIQKQINHRRTTHKLSEQRRRKILNSRFEDLREIVPACRDSSHTKQTILSKALQYIDQIMKNITCQEDNIMSMSKERERQLELMREHQMWQRKLEYLRMNQATRTMHHFNMMVPNMNQLNMPKIPTEAM
ncbi:hypothetical protein ACHWQZ_G012089 [Mnemiopsis leidyi]